MNGGYVIDNLRIKIVSAYSCFQLWVHILLFDKQERIVLTRQITGAIWH